MTPSPETEAVGKESVSGHPGTLNGTVSGVRDGLSGGRLDGWSVGGGSFIRADNREYGYRCGYITTPNGVVGFYDQIGRGKTAPHTSFDFCRAGRTHRITWDRNFTDRFLITLAKRFAAVVTSDTTEQNALPREDQ